MLENIWYCITYLGDPQFWAYLSFILLLMYFIIRDNASKKTRRGLKFWLIILIPALSLSLLLTLGLKIALPIERPCIPCEPGIEICNEYCPSGIWEGAFPSGHAVTGFVAFTSIFLISPRRKLIPIFIVPILIAASRIALGVHTYTDIIAGSIIGLFITLLVWQIKIHYRK